jgi:O-antigen ligase
MRVQESEIPYWQAAHNSYIQILTETGAFGGIAFVALILACLKTFNGFRRDPGSLQHVGLHVLPGMLLIGFMSLLVSAFFLSQAYSIPFTLFFALAASLKRIQAISNAATAPVPALSLGLRSAKLSHA